MSTFIERAYSIVYGQNAVTSSSHSTHLRSGATISLHREHTRVSGSTPPSQNGHSKHVSRCLHGHASSWRLSTYRPPVVSSGGEPRLRWWCAECAQRGEDRFVWAPHQPTSTTCFSFIRADTGSSSITGVLFTANRARNFAHSYSPIARIVAAVAARSSAC